MQYHTFRFFLRRIYEGAKQPMPAAMHDASVRCLQVERTGDTLEEEMMVVGLTGSAADLDLLERLYHKYALPDDY